MPDHRAPPLLEVIDTALHSISLAILKPAGIQVPSEVFAGPDPCPDVCPLVSVESRQRRGMTERPDLFNRLYGRSIQCFLRQCLAIDGQGTEVSFPANRSSHRTDQTLNGTLCMPPTEIAPRLAKIEFSNNSRHWQPVLSRLRSISRLSRRRSCRRRPVEHFP